MKKKHAVIVLIMLLIAIIAGMMVLKSGPLAPTYGSVEEELDALITGFVDNDKAVRNCVLSVVRGDSSLVWSGAAGLANVRDYLLFYGRYV